MGRRDRLARLRHGRSRARRRRYLAPDADGLRRIQAKHAFLKPMSVPAGSYSGSGHGDRLGRLVELHHGAAGLSEDTAYRLARALHRGRAALGRRLPQAADTTAANTVAAAPRLDLIHPGVRRYLSEIGLLR